MKKVSSASGFCVCAVVMVVALLVVEVSPVAVAVKCRPAAVELSPCLGAITSSTPPSKACCKKVREQRPCFCDYLKDPSLRQYVNSPGSRRAAITCGVPFPTC